MKGTKPKLVIDNDAVDRVPPAPAWMGRHSKAEWRRIMPPLVQRRILTKADLGSVENYCIAIGRAREFEDAIQTETDTEVMLKLFRAQDKAAQTARQLAAELGLTPVSRSRPSIREEDDADSLLD